MRPPSEVLLPSSNLGDDALGRLSVRHPEHAERYLLSCSRSPELVTAADIMEFDLDNNPVDQRGRPMYIERSIHGCVYRARPDVNAVCHSHAPPLIPFTVTGVPLKPVWVMGAVVGEQVPVWDIRADFPGDDGMLIVNNAIASSMAKGLGADRTYLLAGHGAVVVEATIKRVVVAVSLVTNAGMLMQSRMLNLADGARALRYLTRGEINAMTELIFNRRAIERMWDYWATRSGYSAQAIRRKHDQ